jgi:hypothetical protein
MNLDLNYNDFILGVLTRLHMADEKTFDRREGVVSGCYRREFLKAVRDDGTRERALVYVANGPDEGAPRPGYLQRILAGARHHDLPAAAITEVESLNQQRA